MVRKGAGAPEGRTRMLGIDVSKQDLRCCWLTADRRQPVWEGTVPNSPTGLDRLLRQTPPALPWVVEPTGQYSRLVEQVAHQAGRQLLHAPPNAAKAFLRAVSPRAKTDRLDSRGLAQYALAVPLRAYSPKSPVVEQIEQLLAARAGISQSLSRLGQQRRALPAAAAPLEAALATLQAERDELDRQLRQRCPREMAEIITRFRAVPGIGAVTATAVAACLQSKPFRHADQFVAFVGLDVQVRDSGQRRGQRTLTKQGDAELRRLLYLCAMANRRSRDPDNPFAQQYARERAKGLSTTGALCAVARKLARTCWSLYTHGTTYDPARVQQQPNQRGCC